MEIDKNKKHVAVHCQKLSYIDSAGLGSFIYLRRTLQDGGHQFYLTAIGGWLKKFLQVTGLETTLTATSRSGS